MRGLRGVAAAALAVITVAAFAQAQAPKRGGVLTAMLGESTRSPQSSTATSA